MGPHIPDGRQAHSASWAKEWGPIQFCEEPNRGLSETIGNRVAKWVRFRRLRVFYLPKIVDYNVRFKKRREVFDLIECSIRISIGSKIWVGFAMGLDSIRAFEQAFVKIQMEGAPASVRFSY